MGRTERGDETAVNGRMTWHSVSSVREYRRCPRRYRFGYRDRRPQDRPVPVSWRFGSLIHAGLEAGYRQRLADPRSSRSDVLAHVNEALDDAWESLELGDDADPATLDRARWVVGRALVRDVIGADHILDVEVALRGTVNDQEQIIGFADLVLAHGDAAIEIVDHKITRRHTTPDTLREDLQLNLYGQLARTRWPWASRVAVTHHYPLDPTAVSTVLDEHTMTAALDYIHEVAAQIRTDDRFLPQPGDHCDHCPWLPSCADGVEWSATYGSKP